MGLSPLTMFCKHSQKSSMKLFGRVWILSFGCVTNMSRSRPFIQAFFYLISRTCDKSFSWFQQKKLM